MSYIYDILTKFKQQQNPRLIKIFGVVGTSSVDEICSACVALSDFNYSECGSYYISVGDRFMKIETDQTMSRAMSINHKGLGGAKSHKEI